eukprot:13381212-Heterocapsa_arctica.AAC.1
MPTVARRGMTVDKLVAFTFAAHAHAIDQEVQDEVADVDLDVHVIVVANGVLDVVLLSSFNFFSLA